MLSPTQRNLLLFSLVLWLFTGCASELIDVRPGSQLIPVLPSAQVANCQFKGNTTVSVLAQVGYLSRSVEAIDADLLQLARNAALDAGGNALVKGDRPELGKQVFAVYRCDRP